MRHVYNRYADRMWGRLCCISWVLSAVLACTSWAAQGYERAGVSIEAKTIKLSRTMNRIEASGDVHLSASNPAAKVRLSAEARRVTVTLSSAPGTSGSVRGLDSIKQADFDGPVKMVYTAPKSITDQAGNKTGEVLVTTTVTADRAAYDGVQGVATLSGNVRIVQDDPSVFAEPVVMTGDKASINLKRGQEAGDYDFKIESTGKPSRIEIVPKQQAKQ
ncbi:MAG: LptA/OstA family protein [Armatimonadota bacterium]|nr:LptA/OstA family protein [Armatimonadota bacterium]